MSEANQELRRIDWVESFPFIRLFRAFTLARDPKVLALALCGVILTYLAGRILDGMWPADSQPKISVATNLSEMDLYIAGQRTGIDLEAALGTDTERIGVFKLMMNHARTTANRLTEAALHLSVGGILDALRFGVMGPVWLVQAHFVFAILFTLAKLAIWALFGGAIARIMALNATREEYIGMGEAIAFARTKFWSFFAAPLIPAAALLAVLALLAVGGMFGAIPFVGELAVGLFFGLALLLGLAAAFVMIGAVAGFPLLAPTIALEGSDAFDAFARSYSYIYQRPWRTAFYALVSIIYGSICFVFVKWFARLMLWAVFVGLGSTMNWGGPFAGGSDEAAVEKMGKLDAMWQGPTLSAETPFKGEFVTRELSHASWLARYLLMFWVYMVWGLVAAFGLSLFYAASTLTYLLLRRAVDATDMEDVYLEDMPELEGAGTSAVPQAEKPAAGGTTSLPVIP